MKYESPITYHSKDMANVKVFADRQTGQKLFAPNLSIRGHKKINPIRVALFMKHKCPHIDMYEANSKGGHHHQTPTSRSQR
jgi:hypothetical protein